jgi:hypothetical protein
MPKSREWRWLAETWRLLAFISDFLRRDSGRLECMPNERGLVVQLPPSTPHEHGNTVKVADLASA